MVSETHLPSGEKRPFDSPSPKVTCVSLPAAMGTTQRWLVLVFFSSDTSVTENMTHLPLGEIWGSLTRFMACRSANVMGRLSNGPPRNPCAPATPPITHA